jgi:hypothetical protein
VVNYFFDAVEYFLRFTLVCTLLLQLQDHYIQVLNKCKVLTFGMTMHQHMA